MSLNEQISQTLAAMKGFSSESPRAVGWTAEGGPTVEADLTAVDSLSCALRELRIGAPELAAAPIEALREWANQVCQRVTYLLEPVGSLEADTEARAVLIRSTPPATIEGRKAFYEMWVKAPGVVSLRRYLRAPGAGERQAIDLQITQEALLKLVRDIIDAIPALQAA